MKSFFKWLAIAFVALLVIGLIFGGDTSEQKIKENKESTLSNSPSIEAVADTPAVEPETIKLSGPQKNAIRSAKQYISIAGFSHEGLIDQLSSSYGDDYNVTDATTAVDSLNIDWNEQAARSAKQYLDISGFSCNGLIEQLSSNSGDKYTLSQATYGAKQAGACS